MVALCFAHTNALPLQSSDRNVSLRPYVSNMYIYVICPTRAVKSEPGSKDIFSVNAHTTTAILGGAKNFCRTQLDRP